MHDGWKPYFVYYALPCFCVRWRVFLLARGSGPVVHRLGENFQARGDSGVESALGESAIALARPKLVPGEQSNRLIDCFNRPKVEIAQPDALAYFPA